jgi:hypothetical protein
MARPLRVQYPGAVYHVMARGHERANLFRDDTDREKFVALLAATAREEGWDIHAYCLMGNHYHLLVETPLGELSHGMHFDQRPLLAVVQLAHKRRGHFLEGRFKAVARAEAEAPAGAHPVRRPEPVRAGLAAGRRLALEQLPRNGRAAERAGWLKVDWTLEQFARSRSAARQAFRRFVAEGKGSGDDVEELLRKPYLGDQEFRKRVQAILEGKPVKDEIPLRYRKATALDLDAVRKAVAKEWGVTPEALSRSRGGADKKAAIYLARKLTRLKGREIGEAFGVRPARVSNVVSQIEAGQPPALARRVERVRKRLEQSV